MKILSRLLSLFFPDMNPDDISVELIFITLILKSQWTFLVAVFKQGIRVFNDTKHAGGASLNLMP